MARRLRVGPRDALHVAQSPQPGQRQVRGFFGTLKSDFFDHRDWSGVSFEEFGEALDGYIEWYRCKKLKKSLGWKTIRQHREELGYAA